MRTGFWSGPSRWLPSNVARNGSAALALLVGAVLAAYLCACWGAFQFDDYNIIVHNIAVQSFPAYLASMPGIRPILKLSYTLNWTSGLGLFGFHLFNLLCHAASAACVYFLCRKWINSRGHGGEWARPIALTAALLFALHPAQTEAVTYVSGRSVSLMSLFYLCALLAHARGEERGASLWRDGLSPLLFVAALLVKETAWTLPFALLLWDVGARRASWRERLRRLRAHWAVLGLAAAAMLATPGYRRLLVGSLVTRTLKENLLTQVGGQFYLLTQPLLLLQVNIDRDLPALTGLSLGLALKAAALLALVLAGCFQLRRRPWLGVGLLWTFLHLLPTNSILPRLDVANDRQLYLAMIGPAVILAATIWCRLPRRAAAVAALVLALGLGTATLERNADYRTEVALWQATVRDSPNKARAWNNLGYVYQLAGDVAAARRAYGRALALDPTHIKARFNAASLPPPAETRESREPRAGGRPVDLR